MKGQLNNKISILMILLVIFQVLAPPLQMIVEAKEVSNVIDDIEINQLGPLDKTTSFGISANWSIEDGAAKEGDTFTVNFSDEINLQRLRGRLPLIGSDGAIYAYGTVDKVSGKILFTFTDEVEKRSNIGGHFSLQGLLLDVKDPDPDKGIENKEVTITEEGGKTFEREVIINNGGFDVIGESPSGPSNPHREKNFDKVGQIKMDPDGGTEAEKGDMYWYVYVNGKEESQRVNQAIEVGDTIQEGHRINLASFSLTIADSANDNSDGFEIYGQNQKEKDKFNDYISDFKLDEKSYSLKFKPDIGQGVKALRIYYHTIIEEDADPSQNIFENKYDVSLDDGRKIIVDEQVDFGAMIGSGYGDPSYSGEMQIAKVDQNNQPIKEKGIRFKIRVKPGTETGYNNDFEETITTDKDGIAKLSKIPAGIYLVKELNAPSGYIKEEEEKQIVLNFSHVASLEREKETININIEAYKSYRPSDPEYYDGLIKEEEAKLAKKEREIARLKSIGIDFKFKNIGSERISIEAYKKWDIKSKDKNFLDSLEGTLYLVRNSLEYDENDNLTIKKERVKGSDKKVKYSEDIEKVVWNDLIKTNEFGEDYIYTVQEEKSSDYEIKYETKDGKLYITNCSDKEDEIETVDIEVNKEWLDHEGNQLKDGLPEYIIVDLYKNNQAYLTFKLEKNEGYSIIIEDLDKYELNENGEKVEIEYELIEHKLEGFESKVQGDAEEGFLIQNRKLNRPEELVDIKVKKEWLNSDGEPLDDKEIPDNIIITLYADGEEYLSGNIKKEDYSGYTIKNLPKHNKDGEVIEYSVTEKILDGYEKPKVEKIEDYSFILTNKKEKPPVKPEEPEETVDLKIKKVWEKVEGEVTESELPEYIIITVLKDGEEYLTGRIPKNEYDGYIVEKLPKYNKDGSTIKYTIKEEETENYENVKINHDENDNYSFTIVNTIKEEEPPVKPEETVELKVKKKWQDKYGEKPDESDLPEYIIITVLKDGQEYLAGRIPKSEYNGYTIENLPKYNKDDNLINYTIEEEDGKNYKTLSIVEENNNEFIITNQLEEKPVVNDETIDIEVVKKWDEEPEDIEYIIVNLKRNNEKFLKVRIKKEDGWKFKFENLKKYDSNGKRYVYSVEEERVSGYKSLVTGNMEKGYTIENEKISEETIDIEVEKDWIKSFSDDDLPNYVRFQLYKDGEEYLTARLLKSKGWKGSFKNLPKYNENGEEIVYELEEIPLENFRVRKTGDFKTGFKFVNIEDIRPLDNKIDISVSKTWSGKSLDSIKVYLLANGKRISEANLNKHNNYQTIFKELPEVKDGKVIKYSVEEEELDNYKVSIEGNSKDGFTIRNEYVDEEKPTRPTKPNRPDRPDKDDSKKYKDIRVRKYWDGKKLDKVTIKLLSEGKEIDRVDLSEDNNWEWTFKDLDKDKTYSVEEELNSDYRVKISKSDDGFVIYNTEITNEEPPYPEDPKEPEKPEEPGKEEPKDPTSPEKPEGEKPEGPSRPTDKDEGLSIEEEYPLGAIRPDGQGPISKLPKTGENFRIINYILGIFLIVLGLKSKDE